MQPQRTQQGILSLLIKLFLKKAPAVHEAFKDDHLVRRKYILSRVSEHFGTDKFEPAPLLNKTLLDVGCGHEKIAQELALRGADCIAIDPNKAAIKMAQDHAARYGTPVTFIASTAEELTKENQTFDVILCLDVLEESTSPQALGKALYTLLKPDGILIFSFIPGSFKNYMYYKILTHLFWGWPLKATHLPFARLNKRKIIHTLEDAGFKIQNITGLAFSLKEQRWLKVKSHTQRAMGVAVKKEASPHK